MRRASNQVLHGKDELCLWNRLTHGRQRPQVHDDRREVFIGQITEVFVRHERKQRAAVVADAFANGPRELVVGPVSRSRFLVGCDVRRIHLAWEIQQRERRRTSPVRARFDWRVVLSPVSLAMARKAVQEILGEVAPAIHPFGRRGKPAIGQRPGAGTDERTPPDCGRNGDDEQHDERCEYPTGNFQ